MSKLRATKAELLQVIDELQARVCEQQRRIEQLIADNDASREARDSYEKVALEKERELTEVNKTFNRRFEDYKHGMKAMLEEKDFAIKLAKDDGLHTRETLRKLVEEVKRKSHERAAKLQKEVDEMHKVIASQREMVTELQKELKEAEAARDTADRIIAAVRCTVSIMER